jgi:hypothetical protein
MACTGPGAIPSFLVARPGRKQSSAGAITDACLWAKASAGRALSPVAPPPTDLSITAHSTGCRSPPKRGPPRWPCPVLLRRSRTGAVPRDWLRGLSSGPSPPAGLRCSASPRERVRLRLPPRVSPPFQLDTDASVCADASYRGASGTRGVCWRPLLSGSSKRFGRAPTSLHRTAGGTRSARISCPHSAPSSDVAAASQVAGMSGKAAVSPAEPRWPLSRLVLAAERVAASNLGCPGFRAVQVRDDDAEDARAVAKRGLPVEVADAGMDQFQIRNRGGGASASRADTGAFLSKRGVTRRWRDVSDERGPHRAADR